MNNKGRWAILQVSMELLFDFIKTTKEKFFGSCEVVMNGLLDDAIPVGVFIDEQGVTNIIVESSEYDMMIVGKAPPILNCPVVEVTNNAVPVCRKDANEQPTGAKQRCA